MKTSSLVVILAGLGLLVAIAGSLWFLRSNFPSEERVTTGETKPAEGTVTTGEEGQKFTFSDPKKSAHYESNTPAHGEVLPGSPVAIVIDFNFDLASGSKLSVNQNGRDYGTGATTIDNNKLAMRRTMSQGAPDGVYTVEYTACWPDSSCHDGFFQFAIDRSQAANYTDWRNQDEVKISEKNLQFAPQLVRVSRGTTITWNNADTVDHYVNTDSHPAHTQFPLLNSQVLKPGDQYSFRLDQPGVYRYHCSAHAGLMTGTILVD